MLGTWGMLIAVIMTVNTINQGCTLLREMKKNKGPQEISLQQVVVFIYFCFHVWMLKPN